MAKFFSRIGQTVQLYKVDVELMEVLSQKMTIDSEIVIEWKRGPQTDTSARYNFSSQS